ncbi:autophagy- protein 2 [Cadophora gregata]|uniref:autophagy- protein 2 n=1 Tax=Cadophora gregata TaxID=51156 RepID=UPI0026DD4F33|nr:autophagy- protein 2 [Cadophora gregata]KAK0107371.1 autophagy- protein 2 [Cadophora gregata]KAK0117050.1 autophagy- protein 2, variant 2 [Cadophora gregata f. sp. sojae]
MASYFQSYFQTSSMPKRLLQYVLTRIEILDTDALDLQNLDIAWGKNSTFEFRDVALRMKKLEGLLHLPPSLELVNAQLLLLRVTIPVDIYSSPIIIEIDGIESLLRVKSRSETGTAHPSSSTNHDRSRKRPPTPSTRQPHKFRGTYEGTAHEDEGPVVPTAVDLAASFLQTEPEEERAEFEAAILSETQDFGDSSVLSDDGEIPVGTGTALSLPNFMASFIQGIVDRLQVRIRGITVNLDIEIPPEPSKRTAANQADTVTFQLKVEDIDIQGVTHGLEKVDGNERPSQPPYRKGTRLVFLSNIRGFLISEANLFSTLARSSALSSPSARHSDMLDDGGSKAGSKTKSGIHESTHRIFDSRSSAARGFADSGSDSMASLTENASSLRSITGSVVASDSGRFEDAPEDDETSNTYNRRGDLSEVGGTESRESAFRDRIAESEYMDEEQSMSQQYSSNVRVMSHSSTPRASIHMPVLGPGVVAPDVFDFTLKDSPHFKFPSTILPTRSHPRFSHDRISHSQPSLHTDLPPTHRGDIPSSQPLNAGDVGVDDSDGEDEYDNGTPPAGEDLAQSQLFSHEDAESMYMSAVSHSSSTDKVPGGWARSSGSEERPPRPHSPVSIGGEEGSACDNLEHARHAGPSELQPDSLETEDLGPPKLGRLPFTAQKGSPDICRGSSDASEGSAASPDEYKRLTKSIFSLDHINVYFPAISHESGAASSEASSELPTSSVSENQNFASQYTSINVPGAFSTHLPSSWTPQPQAVETGDMQTTQSAEDNDAIEVAFGKLLVQFDIAIGKLVCRLVAQLKDIFKTEAQPMGPGPQLGSHDRRLTIGFEDISVKFLERLDGVLGSSRSPPTVEQFSETPSPDVLLRMSLTGLDVQAQTSREVTKTAITLKKFIFGYAQENIVSFDATLQMRASVKDLKASDGIDVSLNITQTAHTTRFEIFTLPLHVSIDLRRLDETFNWFGGLSGVLNLGSSIASNATVTATSPSKPIPRGVRFETPIRPDDISLNAQNKADVRFGGFILDLVGTECSIGVETSAVKVVSRDEGIGVFIQRIRLSGPHLKRSHEEPAINMDIAATRIEYLATPKDADLDRLLSLITPSKAKYDQDDDILLDTLLRQRNQGAVVRLTVENIQTQISKLNELGYLPELGEEVSRLATVAKYLPDDDRPGLLSLIMVRNVDVSADVGGLVGTVQLSCTDVEIAQITLPSLIALSIGGISARRNTIEDLIGIATDPGLREPRDRSPALMARLIGDEMEPVVKIKLWNLRLEYRVPTLMTLLGLAENATTQDISASLTASVATLTDFTQPNQTRSTIPRGATVAKSGASKPLAIDIVLRDCILGMNPLSLPSKVLVVLTEAHVEAILPKDQNASVSMEMNKASILVVDNAAHLTSAQAGANAPRYSFDGGSTQVADLCATGYVSVSYISSAKAFIKMSTSGDGERALDVELRDDLFVLESCADSTQTLIAVLSNLSPPTLPNKETKYRTKVIPVHDLLASLSGDAFGTAEGDYDFDDDFGLGEGVEEDFPGEDVDFDFDSHYYRKVSEAYDPEILGEEGISVASTHVTSRDTHDGVLLESIAESLEVQENQELEFQEDHFGTGSVLEGTAHRWNSAKNTYDRSNAFKVRKSPLKVCIRDVHFIWNLFDGYDWQHTRDAISMAVQDVESKAIEKRSRNERRPTFDQDIDDEETVIGDFLFNSIYIGIPANRDPRDLAAAINQELNDNITDTESIATTSLSSSPSSKGGPRNTKTKKLHLQRSKHHKITFELRGVSVDLVSFPPGSGETQSSVDIRVHDFEIFDHVPTSTWRKFATYMQDAGERETGTNMIHIEILNVKPIPELAAAEIVLKATVLPLRLHVDQDALDFITRFFEFKDDSAPTHTSPSDLPFLQRVEVNSIKVKLDFKPKRVDYAGLRSGHTTEFMNFLILDEADMVLRHTIIYGISGFDKLGKCLNDIWMPDIKRNQLPGILAGLAPVRSLVNVGGGFRHLVVVPMREYRKDGRIVRGISKGAAAFVKSTGTELVKLGAKVAVGVQTVLQGAEDFLGPVTESSALSAERDDSDGENKQISLYANQPVGVFQGLRGGYAGLQRDLIVARDAIIAVPGEVMEGGNAAGALRAVRKHAPTVILRPAIGFARAGGQILMGATNSLDPVHLQRAEAKYKKH